MDTYYSVLDIQTNAGDREINRAYRQKVLLVHPDINKRYDAHAQTQLLNEAYRVLSSPKLREDYDKYIGVHPRVRTNGEESKKNPDAKTYGEYTSGQWGRRRADWNTENSARGPSSSQQEKSAGHTGYRSEFIPPQPNTSESSQHSASPRLSIGDLYGYFRTELLFWVAIATAIPVTALLGFEVLPASLGWVIILGWLGARVDWSPVYSYSVALHLLGRMLFRVLLFLAFIVMIVLFVMEEVI